MGGRLLRHRLMRPCLQLEEIEARLDAVQEILQATIARSEIRKLLADGLDLERLLAKLTLGTAGPRGLRALGRCLGGGAPPKAGYSGGPPGRAPAHWDGPRE